MEKYEREIRICRCVHYASGLSVRLISASQTVFSIPETIMTAAGITGDSSLSPEQQTGSSSARYASTPAGENYIILQIAPELFAYVGPFLVESPSSAYMTSLIRSGVIRLRDKNAVQEHLSSLLVLSSKQFYYLGELLEMLFSSESDAPPDVSGEATVTPDEARIPDSYFIRSQDYRSELFLHSPYMVEQEICHFISSGDTDGALRVLAEINSRPRAKLAKNTVRSLKNSMICSCAFMARAAIAGGVSADEAFTLSDTFIQEIEAASDIRSILDYEVKMVRGYTAAVKALSSKGRSKPVMQAVDYINAHLCEELSIGTIADAVFLNPNYLSGLFVKETGETLHSFIIRRRIEDAAFMVRYTEEPFAEIASFYRFCSQSHFTQCFREILGTTPGRYRNSKT